MSQPKRPRLLRLEDADPREPERGRVVMLAPRGKLRWPHALLDLREVDGTIELNLTQARHLRDWLSNYLEHARAEGPKPSGESTGTLDA